MTSSSSQPEDFLDKFTRENKDGFQLLSHLQFPVEFGYGYVHDEKTNRLYVAGGYKDGKRHDKLYEMELTVYDGSLWLRIVRTLDLPHGKGIYGCVCVLLYNKVFIIGGRDDNNYLEDVYSFDRETGRWQKEASMKEKRQYPSVALTNGGTTMLVSGGNGGSIYSSTTWTVVRNTVILQSNGHSFLLV